MTCVSTKKTSVSQTTPVKIVDANASRVQLIIISSSAAFIGGSDLTSSNGFPVGANVILTVPSTGCQAAVYALGNTVNPDVAALEFNLL